MDILPVEPFAEPELTMILPEVPTPDTPVASVSAPVLPDELVPVLNKMLPEFAVVEPPLPVTRYIAPDCAPPRPVTTYTAPPVEESEVVPAYIAIFPPTEEPELPTTTEIEPDRPEEA